MPRPRLVERLEARRENGFSDEVNRKLAVAVSKAYRWAVVTLDEAGLETYLAVCSACLARAHAQTGAVAGIAGYGGKKSALDRAIASFVLAYADQTQRDYPALVAAEESGRVSAKTGV